MIKKSGIVIGFIILVLLLLSSITVNAQTCTTTVPGGLVVNTTWTPAGSPYCITGDIQVSLLIIEPGVEVIVDGPYIIDVLSTINAIGTEAEPILFSAAMPLAPDNQRWKGIKFEDTPPGSRFIHAIIEYSNDSAITLINSSPPELDNCTIQNNSKTGQGGGIHATGVIGDLELMNCEFIGNTSTSHGGALRVGMSAGFMLNIADSIFENNIANPSRASGNIVGGALYLEPGVKGIISRSLFTGNRSNSRCASSFGCNVIARGGAIYISDSGDGNITIENSDFVANQADALNQGQCFFGGSSQSFGAGVYVNSGTVALANDTFSCNTTTRTNCGPSDAGSGLYVNGGAVEVVNSTIARNADATGIHLAGGTLDVMNSIVYFNNGNGTQIGGAATVTYSDVQGQPVYPGIGNINYNPVFAGTTCDVNDLYVVLGSLAIDGGNPDPIYNDQCLPPGQLTERNDMGFTGGDNCFDNLEDACLMGEITLMGDINNDCKVDISDVILVLRMALDLDPDQVCADINSDGIVDISDVIRTLRIALGLDALQQCNGVI